jgi:hypothetical protein
MDIEEIIRLEVNKAVKESVSHIKIVNEIYPPDKWVNKTQAREVLGNISPTTFRKWIKDAKIKENRFGYLKYSDLMAIK